MITFYAFGRVNAGVHGLTRDLRVDWAFEELGLPHEVRPVDHTGGELDRDEIGAMNPFRQLPVLDDDGLVLSESAAILVHLADKAGALVPADPRGRAEVLRWCFAALATVEPPLQELGLMKMMGKVEETKAWHGFLQSWTARVLGGVEAWLDGREHLAGDFSVADILMTTVMRLARRAGLLEPYPRCDAYRRRCQARPAFARAAARYEARLHAEPGAVERAADPR